MQQAYQAIRIVSEAQTIRVVLSSDPDESMLGELCTVCASLAGEASKGIKAVVLDFINTEKVAIKDAIHRVPTNVEGACSAVRGIAQPVLAVARDTLSPAASLLLSVADLSLVAEHARLTLIDMGGEKQEGMVLESAEQKDAGQEDAIHRVPTVGAHAARLRYVTWAVPVGEIEKEMERVLNMLREKSAIALRNAKASARLGQSRQPEQSTPLEALQRVNTLYLEQVMRTKDASEGLRAFLEKRKPDWNNT